MGETLVLGASLVCVAVVVVCMVWNKRRADRYFGPYKREYKTVTARAAVLEEYVRIVRAGGMDPTTACASYEKEVGRYRFKDKGAHITAIFDAARAWMREQYPEVFGAP